MIKFLLIVTSSLSAASNSSEEISKAEFLDSEEELLEVSDEILEHPSSSKYFSVSWWI